MPKPKPKTPAKPARKPAPKPTSGPLPEQKLGDTPVPPWKMPTPEEKEQARPVRRALKKAVKKVDLQAKADRVVKHLEQAAAGQTAEQVKAQQAPKSTPAAAKKVEKAAGQHNGEKKAEKVIEATGKALAAAEPRAASRRRGRPGGAQPAEPGHRRRTRGRDPARVPAPGRAQAPQAAGQGGRCLFLQVNHLPHTPLLNRLFYTLTFIFTGGTAWFVVLGLNALRRRRRTYPLLRNAALPLLLAGLTVEHPIKQYFKRKRPFISIIQAIVIGKKPGTWSFPSGHSATAFAGAWLLNKSLPRFKTLRYLVAGGVAFSRIYLGDHYPGDVISGSLLGLLFARILPPHRGAKKRAHEIKQERVSPVIHISLRGLRDWLARAG